MLAEAQLLLGNVASAAAAAAQAAASGRTPALNIRMHTQLVDARIALSSGGTRTRSRQIAHGLDDLAQFQTRFGSQDMQAAAAVHGGALARTGLRTAVDTGEPRVILPWLERSRAATTRLPAIRPPNDPELVENLAQLRMAVKTARDATLAGRPDPALQMEITETRARIRAKTWTTGGVKGRPHRPITLTAVQRHLREHEPDTTVLAFFHGQGKIHALVVTARKGGLPGAGGAVDRRAPAVPGRRRPRHAGGAADRDPGAHRRQAVAAQRPGVPGAAAGRADRGPARSRQDPAGRRRSSRDRAVGADPRAHRSADLPHPVGDDSAGHPG